MAERGIDLLIVTGAENGYYLSGLLVGTPQVFLALVLPIEGAACWVVRQTELSNVRTMAATSWGKEGLGVPDEADPIDILAGYLRERGATRARIGVERQGWFFHADYQHRLEAVLTGATFLDSTGLAEVKRFHGASEVGLEGALTSVRAGMTSGEADAAVREPIERAGYGEYFVVRAAYGIGLSFGPCWSEDRLMNMRPGDDRVLEPGMCFHVVPALYKQGLGAVCCSMPVVVTKAGLDPLIDLEPKLFVKG